jgi:hypothetical protein
MLVPQAVRDGYVAATNAVSEGTISANGDVNPLGSFTDPEYAQVGSRRRKLARHTTSGRVRVDELALIPISFPTYTDVLFRAASLAAAELEPIGTERQEFMRFAA